MLLTDRACRSTILVLVLFFCLAHRLDAAVTTVNFTLDEPCQTSAGVFKKDGTLVRTLWSKIRYYFPGNYSATWDGLDDYSNAVPAGTYEVRVLQHNTQYIWDGCIGNTSAEKSGLSVHIGYLAMQDMTIPGTNAYYVSGYDEGKLAFRSFATNDPQHVASSFFWDINQTGGLVNARAWRTVPWIFTTTDGQWVYFACKGSDTGIAPLNANGPGCIVACLASNNALARFTTGILITNGASDSLPNGIYAGTQPGLSGLSVQYTNNLLAAAVAPDNKVYLFDKRSGSALNQFAVSSPGRMSFAPDGTLWVISGTDLICYSNLPANPTVARKISNLKEPLAVAVNPTNADIILVADGGSSQQIKAFDHTGTSIWTYGQAGGYPSNGVAVATDKFWFSYEGVHQTFLTFAPDGSFWVGDLENHRVLHYSAAREYIEQIMYQPHSYKTAVDQNNCTRVFNQFLEFSVDYTQPLSQAWKLVRNWKVNVSEDNDPQYSEGLYQVTTFPNGRTPRWSTAPRQALANMNCANSKRIIFESRAFSRLCPRAMDGYHSVPTVLSTKQSPIHRFGTKRPWPDLTRTIILSGTRQPCWPLFRAARRIRSHVAAAVGSSPPSALEMS